MAAHLPGTILVIDDEPSVRRALIRLLGHDGYRVGTARNGRDALTQLQAQAYDVIVCDLRMPELDGPAFYTLLTRQYPALRQLVIFSRAMPGARPAGRSSRSVAARGSGSPVRSRRSVVPFSRCSRPSHRLRMSTPGLMTGRKELQALRVPPWLVTAVGAAWYTHPL